MQKSARACNAAEAATLCKLHPARMCPDMMCVGLYLVELINVCFALKNFTKLAKEVIQHLHINFLGQILQPCTNT